MVSGQKTACITYSFSGTSCSWCPVLVYPNHRSPTSSLCGVSTLLSILLRLAWLSHEDGPQYKTIGATAPLDAVYRTTVPRERWRFGLNRASHTGKGSRPWAFQTVPQTVRIWDFRKCTRFLIFFSQSSSSSSLSSNSLTIIDRRVKEQNVSFNNKPRCPITISKNPKCKLQKAIGKRNKAVNKNKTRTKGKLKMKRSTKKTQKAKWCTNQRSTGSTRSKTGREKQDWRV